MSCICNLCVPTISSLNFNKINFGKRVNISTPNYKVHFVTKLSHFLFIPDLLPVMFFANPLLFHTWFTDPLFTAWFKCHIFPLKLNVCQTSVVQKKGEPFINSCWLEYMKLRWFCFSFLLYLLKLYDFISIYTYVHTYKHTLILIILTPLSYEVLKGRKFLYIDFVYPVIIKIVYIIGTQKYLWLLD